MEERVAFREEDEEDEFVFGAVWWVGGWVGECVWVEEEEEAV